MDKNIKEDRRGLIKGTLLAGAIAFIGKGVKDANANGRNLSDCKNEEILYRETPEFKEYYESLRN